MEPIKIFSFNLERILAVILTLCKEKTKFKALNLWASITLTGIKLIIFVSKEKTIF